MATYTTFAFTADDLFHEDNSSDNYTAVTVRTKDYDDGYARINNAVKVLFGDGHTVRYNVIEGVVDSEKTCLDDSRYRIVESKDFEKHPLPKTLEDYHTAMRTED